MDDDDGEGHALFEHYGSAGHDADQNLVEAVAKRDREDAEHHVVLVVFQISGDGGGGGGDGLVGDHYAFRNPGGAGSVDDHRQVDVDSAMLGRGRRLGAEDVGEGHAAANRGFPLHVSHDDGVNGGRVLQRGGGDGEQARVSHQG